MITPSLKLKSLFAVFILLANIHAFAADRYWIGNNTNKNWNATANWSTTSGGSGGASVPGASDDVYFNSSGLGELILEVNINVRKFTVSSGYTNTISQNGKTVTIGAGGITLNDGTFTGNTGNITVNGPFALGGASFTSTSASLTIYGNYTKTGGTFSHNNGSVTFLGGAITMTSSVKTDFYDLVFYGFNSGTVITLDAASTFNVIHKFTHAGGTLVRIDGGTLNVQGDIVQSNVYASGGGSGTININGDTDQTWTGQANTTYFGYLCNIKIDKSGGTLFLKNVVTLSGTWEKVNGTVDDVTYDATISFPVGSSHTMKGNQVINRLFLGHYGANLYFTVYNGHTLTVRKSITTGLKFTAYYGNIKLWGDYNAPGNTTIGAIFGTGVIEFCGDGDQTITGNDIKGAGIIPNILINKTSGTLILNKTISVSGNWIWQSGAIDASTNQSTVAFISGTKTISGTHELYNVCLYGDYANYNNIPVGDVLTVAHDLTIESTASYGILINGGTVKALGNISISSGAMNGGTGTLLIGGGNDQLFTGSASKTNGVLGNVTINKTGGTLTLKKYINSWNTWTYQNGTIDGQTNESFPTAVVFNYGSSITGSHALHHVIFTSAYATTTIGIGASTILQVNGNLTLEGSNALTLNTGAVDVYGNFSITNSSASSGGTATITMKGSNNQTVTGNSTAGTGRLPNIKINKTGGTLTFVNTISVGGNLTYVHNASASLNPGSSTVVFPYGTRNITGSFHLNNMTVLANANSFNYIGTTDTVVVDSVFKTDGVSNATVYDGTVSVKGDVKINNTYVATGGTPTGTGFLNICGNNNQTFTGIDAIGKAILGNVTINKTGGTLLLKNIISVYGDFKHLNGVVDGGTSTLYCTKSIYKGNFQSPYNNVSVGNSCTLNSNLDLKGNLKIYSSSVLNSGSYTITIGGNYDNGNVLAVTASTIIFNGSGNQTITKSGGATTETFYGLTVNKPSGKLYLKSPLNVSALTLTKGVLVSTSTNLLNIPDNATSSIGSNQSYVSGPMKKVGDDAFVFPLGDTTITDTSYYHPFAMTAPTGATSSFTAQYLAKNQLTDHPTFTAYASTLKPISTCEYWAFTRNAGTSTVTPTVSWNTNTCNINALADARVAGWNGTQWADLGQNSTTGNQSAGTVKANTAGPNQTNQYYVLAERMPTPIPNQRYWIGNGSNTSWNNTANWSSVSGGPGGSPVPSSIDTVIFDGGGKGESNVDVNVSLMKLIVKSAYNTNAIKQNSYTFTVGTGGMSLSGGTFTGGSGDITNNGSFTLSGTNFTSTSGTFTIYGNYTKSSGSFTHNNGKIVFNTSNTISGSTNFYNLEFSPAGDLTHTLNASDVYNVAGELKLSGTSRLTINAGTIHLNGNLTITNTNTNDPGSYTLSLEGNANQIVNGPAAKLQGALNQLIINKTGGSVTLNNFLSLAGNWTNTSNTTVTGSNTSTVVFTGGSKTISGNNHDFYNLNLYSNGPADGVYTISNAITANGELKLDGNYPAYVNGQINAKGNITAFNGSGSKVDGGTGTITINGTGNQLFSGYDAPMGSRLCNIVVDKASGTLTLANYLTPGHDWKHIKGTVAPGSSVTYITNTGSRKISGHNEFNDVVIYGELYNYDTSHTDVEDTLFVNGQLKYSMRSMTINGGYLAAKGNITIENDGDVVAGTHTLLITGGNNQLFKGLANKQQRGVLNHVTIDKPAGTLTLQDKLTVVGDWIWRNGNMDVDSYDNTLILRGGTRTFGGTHVLKNVTLDGYDTNDPSINNIPSGNVITIKGEFKIDGGHIARVNTGTIKALGNITSNNYAVTEDGGSGTIDIAGEGDQTISGQYAGGGLFCSIKVNKPNGTLNMSGAITLGGSNWTYIQGAVNPGTSKLIYWGNGDVNLVNGSTSMELNSFDLRKGTVNMLSPITARKDFWVSSANSTLNTNSHNINVGGYFLNGGTFNQGTTVITFNGTGRQDAYNANATTYYKIVINKPAGNVYVDGTFTINTNLSLIKGAMVPRNSSTSHYVKILDNATITGGSNKSFVMCGLMKVGDDAFTFPMGDTSLTDSSRYHPFIMPAPAGSVTYTVRYYSKNPLIDFPTYTAIQSPLQSISKCEYWYVEGGPAITPTLGWNENNCNVSSLSDIHVANWDGTQWKDLGNAATTGNTLKGSIQAASASTSAYDKYFVVGNINNVNLDPIASFQNTAGTCIGKTIKFQNTSKHASSYQWKVNNANVSTDVNLSYTFNSIGTYTITLVASNGTTTDTKDGNFVAGTGIAVDAGTDKTIPSGKNITLGGNPTAASGTAPFIYSWTSPSFLSSTIVSNPVAAPLVTTMYHVTVTDAQGCSGGDSILITVFPGFTALIDSTSDLDSGYVKIRLENGTPPYKFYWNGEESSTKEIIQAALDTLPIFDSLGINPSIFANQLSGSEKSYLAPGYYLVMVTDSLNDTAYAEVVISAARRWIVTPSANFDIQEKRITKTGGSGWANSELVSLQMLPNNRETYGGISFIAKTPASTQAVGFRTEPATGATGYDKLKYGFVVDNNALKIIDNGTQVSIGPYDANAVLRLERKDTLIVYSSDDSLLRIVSVPTLENNYISVNISSASTQIEIKSVSGISMEPRLSWTVTNALISPKESGSVKMNVNAPEVVNSFAYEWKNSDNTIIATTKDLTNALPGIYVFKLTYQTPFGSKDISKTIRVGGASKWDLTNVTLSDNPSFFQKPGGDGWNASITSFETLNPAEDAWFEFSVKNNSLSTDILYSFSASNGTSLSTVDYGIGAIKTSIGGNSNVIYYVVDHGVIKSSHAANKDDVFKVKYNAGSHLVDYLQNDKLIYTSPVVVTDPLYVRGNPIKGGGGVIEGPSKVLPEIEFKPSFAILKDKLDGSFYLAENGMLNLKYEEEYTGNTNKLIYRIYNSNGEVINSVSEAVQNVIFKNNYYSFYLDGFSKKIPKNNFYILEITTKKSEKKYLRFKY